MSLGGAPTAACVRLSVQASRVTRGASQMPARSAIVALFVTMYGRQVLTARVAASRRTAWQALP
jgi:hypothetical protein